MSANNPYVNPKSDERLVMQVKALPPEAAKSVLIRLAQGLPSDTVGRALSSALAMHAVMPPTAAPAEPAGPLGKDKGWAEMSDGEKKAAGALGYDEASWEEGLVPEACTKRWETLEGTVKAAAVSLGYTQEEWDAELEPAADEAPAPPAAYRGLAAEGATEGPTSANTALEPAFRSLNVSTDAAPPAPAAAPEAGAVLGKDKEWGGMTAGERDAAAAIGYDGPLWDAGETPPAAALRFAALSTDQRSAVLVLGYTQASWDAEVDEATGGAAAHPPEQAAAAAGETAGKDKSWADMTTGEKRAASVIGFDEAAWEEGRVPVLCTHDWDSLEGQHRSAAIVLGYGAQFGAILAQFWCNF